jgi:hypothetical protein
MRNANEYMEGGSERHLLPTPPPVYVNIEEGEGVWGQGPKIGQEYMELCKHLGFFLFIVEQFLCLSRGRRRHISSSFSFGHGNGVLFTS